MTDRSNDWDDNPEWTEEDFQRARPTAEMLGAAIANALTRPASARRYFGNPQHWANDEGLGRVIIMREISTMGRSLNHRREHRLLTQ